MDLPPTLSFFQNTFLVLPKSVSPKLQCFIQTLNNAVCSLSLSTDSVQFNSVQSLSHVQLFATPWTATRQASLPIINSQSLLKLTSIELMMSSNHLIPCRPLLLLPSSFPASGSSQMSQFVTSGGQSIGVSALASVLPMSIQY